MIKGQKPNVKVQNTYYKGSTLGVSGVCFYPVQNVAKILLCNSVFGWSLVL